MGVGKYSPICPNTDKHGAFGYNCYGETPVEFDWETYDTRTMFDGYDEEGFDQYGYSAFDINGNYVGDGRGIDRYGYTENDYLQDHINGGDLYECASFYPVLKNIVRHR